MARRQTAIPSSGFTSLVVDDQEEILISTKYLLEREGHKVITACGGRKALDLFRPGAFPLILGDYLMPQINGEQLIQEIRKLDEDVQVVVQTGYSGEHPLRAMLNTLDIQGYHDKSEGPDRFFLWVDVALKAAMPLKKIHMTEQAMVEAHVQLRRLSARLFSICKKRRAWLLHGTLEIRYRPEAGTVVRVNVPFAVGSQAA